VVAAEADRRRVGDLEATGQELVVARKSNLVAAGFSFGSES
jgi:hypothetical protein